ncbi:hypothetical protein [uncultured Desulfovibrio sp.]|uniref:hypothetical protein n=1 Tax=uncultured Desulfovibrio sp. TaxID=167968 RepID=UPI0025EADE9B|nr:hypothetical protein [uncultured Desulfovibrio sp.]
MIGVPDMQQPWPQAQKPRCIRGYTVTKNRRRIFKGRFHNVACRQEVFRFYLILRKFQYGLATGLGFRQKKVIAACGGQRPAQQDNGTPHLLKSFGCSQNLTFHAAAGQGAAPPSHRANKIFRLAQRRSLDKTGCIGLRLGHGIFSGNAEI